MLCFTLLNPGLATSYEVGLIDQWANYGISAVGERHILQTTEYYEGGEERSDVLTFSPASWGVEVPDGAQIFGTTSGTTPANAKQFWTGWLVGRRLHMQALMQERPIDAELAAEEIPIFPPVMDKAGLAALYAWRPVGEATALWRRVFSGQIKTQATSDSEALSEIPGRPVVSIAGAIPGDTTQHAVLGWAERTPAGAVLGIAVIKPNGMRVLRSEPVPGFDPFARQRPGVWASAAPAEEKFEVTVALEARDAQGGYKVARFSIKAKPEDQTVKLSAIDLATGSLHSAAFDYLKNHVDAKVHRTYLTHDGRMWIGESPMVRRESVPLDAPLTVLTTRKAYWGVRGPDGTLRFESF